MLDYTSADDLTRLIRPRGIYAQKNYHLRPYTPKNICCTELVDYGCNMLVKMDSSHKGDSTY